MQPIGAARPPNDKLQSQLRYERSLFERLASARPASVCMLTTQYRMHREIAAFSSTMFYDSQLVTPQDNNKMDEGPPPPFGHLRWFDVAAGRSVREGTTQSNELEAAVVLDILKVVVQNQVRAFSLPLSPARPS